MIIGRSFSELADGLRAWLSTLGGFGIEFIFAFLQAAGTPYLVAKLQLSALLLTVVMSLTPLCCVLVFAYYMSHQQSVFNSASLKWPLSILIVGGLLFGNIEVVIRHLALPLWATNLAILFAAIVFNTGLAMCAFLLRFVVAKGERLSLNVSECFDSASRIGN